MAKKIAKNKLKLSGFSYPSFFSVRLSSIIAIVLLLASIGFLYAKNQELERKSEKQNNHQESLVEPQATPTPAPKIEGVKTHQLIECKSELCDGGWMTQGECANSTCCQIGNKWIFYKNKSQCVKDQQALNQNPSPNTSSPSYIYNPPQSYLPCTIYYPALNRTETYYYLTPEQCQKSKESLIVPTPTPIYQTSPPPVLTEEQLQIIADQIEQDIKHCKNEVNAYYNQQVRNCSIQYGGSSAEEMCIYAQNQERDKKLKECERNP